MRYLVMAERVYEPHTGTDEIAKGIKELVQLKENLAENAYPNRPDDPTLEMHGHRDQEVPIWIDCPGQVKVDLKKHHGIDCKLPLKDEFSAGIKLINYEVTNRRLNVHNYCRFLHKSLAEAKFNERRTDYERSPALGHCDGIAALIYFLRMCSLDNPKPRPKRNYETTFYNTPPEKHTYQRVADSMSFWYRDWETDRKSVV